MYHDKSTFIMANNLSKERRVQIVRCLVEGNSIRATCRLTNSSKDAVLRLVTLLGPACIALHDQMFRNLNCERIQCDEIWSYVFSKEQHTNPENKDQGHGDSYVWTALDPSTKLIVTWRTGTREANDGFLFVDDLKNRLANRPQITTDAYGIYKRAIAEVFGQEVDYATATKVYHTIKENQRIDARYSPSKCKEVTKKIITGSPDPDHISTSHNERNNLTMRMHMRRFTRLTNAFSKKFENHVYAVGIHMMWYNLVRIHQTLRCTPAMAAGLTDHVWEIEELIDLIR